MHAPDADVFGAAFAIRDGQPARGAEGQVELGYLVPFGQVRVGIVLAIELAKGGDLAIQRHAREDGGLDGRLVDDRQDAGHAQANRAGVRVRWRRRIVRRAAAEHLGCRDDLGVYFHPDNRLVGHGTPSRTQTRQRMRNPHDIIADARLTRKWPAECETLWRIPMVSGVSALCSVASTARSDSATHPDRSDSRRRPKWRY